MMKTLYFCCGQYVNGRKEYRIFAVRSMQDVREITAYLGLEAVDPNNCANYTNSPDPEEGLVQSALLIIEMSLHRIENVVCCIRPERSEAERMEQHFMAAEVEEYFPKLLDDGTRRNYPWVVDYWKKKIANGDDLGLMVVGRG